jgi:hypothetical protein
MRFSSEMDPVKCNSLKDASEGVTQILSLATQEYLRNCIDSLIQISRVRVDSKKDAMPFRVISDPMLLVKSIQLAESNSFCPSKVLICL